MAMVYNFRDRCLDIMAKRGYSLRELERQTGVTYYQFQKWIDGKYPPVGLLIAIADELEVTVAELLGLNDKADALLHRAIDDAKLAGCNTCRHGKDYGGGYVCTRPGDGMYPKLELTCWEWRGFAKNKTKGR